MINTETLYSLPDITIIPSISSDIKSRQECSPECLGLTGKSGYLPIITAPMDSVVGPENYTIFQDHGISPIIPRTTPLEERIELCAEVFCAFGLAEVENVFLGDVTIHPGKDIYILIDIANGHMNAQIELGQKLRARYGYKVHLMGGNIANPETILEYERAGFNYLRVGIGGGAGCITSTQCGIHYPMASLLDGIHSLFKNRCRKNIKIVADGGIRTYSDAIKCLALGADYVMMGYTLSKCLEASGELYDRMKLKIPSLEIAKKYMEKDMAVFKEYHGMSTKTAQAKMLGVDLEENRHNLKTSEGRTEMVKIEYTLEGWIKNFKSYLTSSMSYTGFRSLEDFIGGPECRVISPSTVELLKK